MDSKTFNEILASRLQADVERIERLTSAMSEVIARETLHGKQIVFPGFGSFEARKREERVSLHPSTGVRMLLPPRLTLSFRPAASLKLKVRNFTPNTSTSDEQ